MVYVTFAFKYWKFFTSSITVPVRTRDLDGYSADIMLIRLRDALKVFGVTVTITTG